jgi:hypothetical protein
MLYIPNEEPVLVSQPDIPPSPSEKKVKKVKPKIVKQDNENEDLKQVYSQK